MSSAGQLPPDHPIHAALHNLRAEFDRLEATVGKEAASAEGEIERELEPAWRKAHQGEPRLAVAGSVAVAIVLQVLLPARYSFHPRWLLPVLGAVLLVAQIIVNPRRITRTSRAIRTGSIALVVVISLANGWSAGELARAIIEHRVIGDAASILGVGAAIYLTNIVVFALWYWEWDRGGPVPRAQGLREYPDFLFAQMTTPEVARDDWHPAFFDYLYLSFTNATAFSPTDTLPLAIWAKMLMMAQSTVAVVIVALVVSHAVNILQ